MSNEINQKFYQMRNTLSKIKNEINTMQKKISTHSSFSSVRHNDSCIANPHNYTSYNQNDIPKQKQITFYKYPTSSLLNANHFIKNKKLLSYTKRVQRKSHPVKVTNESLNVLCDLLEVPSSQMKQKIKKTFAISKEVDDNINGLFNVYKEKYNHFADKDNFYADMKKWIQGKVFRYKMYRKEIEIYKKLCGELMKNSEDDIIERDEISAFVKDKFRNSYSNNNDSVERTNLNRRKVLSASSSLSKYNFAYNTFQ